MCEGCDWRDVQIKTLIGKLDAIEAKGESVHGRLAHELFDYWREKTCHPQAKFTGERKRKVVARLREGYTGDLIRSAIDGAARMPYVSPDGRRFDDLELICRNGSKLESFAERAKGRGFDDRLLGGAA